MGGRPLGRAQGPDEVVVLVATVVGVASVPAIKFLITAGVVLASDVSLEYQKVVGIECKECRSVTSWTRRTRLDGVRLCANTRPGFSAVFIDGLFGRQEIPAQIRLWEISLVIFTYHSGTHRIVGSARRRDTIIKIWRHKYCRPVQCRC